MRKVYASWSHIGRLFSDLLLPAQTRWQQQLLWQPANGYGSMPIKDKLINGSK